MTPATIIERAAADGVRLTLTAPGKLKAIGDKQAVIRWLPILTEHKAELLASLSAPHTAQAIEQSVAEFFEERAAIAEYDGGLSREEAEARAREATERHRLACWERHQRNAELILSLPYLGGTKEGYRALWTGLRGAVWRQDRSNDGEGNGRMDTFPQWIDCMSLRPPFITFKVTLRNP